jgi:UDP-N-acetylmuramate--alanine ligase
MTEKPVVFFVGIGGIGISTLARWFLAQNWAVYGSDRVKSSITVELIKDGAKVKIGHKKANLPSETRLVIYSVAVPRTNPEIVAARARGLKPVLWEEYLGRMTGRQIVLAVAGSHGKSTTAAMLAEILIKAGYDPTVFFGSKYFPGVKGGRTNFRLGRSPFWIIEADEYRDHFLRYHPWAAIVTNIEYEHADYFKNEAAVRKSFVRFIGKINPKGFVVLNEQDENSRRIAGRTAVKKFWISEKQKNRISRLRKILKVPGRHNVSNALAAWAMAENLGVPEKIILSALAGFRGIWRRLEYRGKNSAGMLVYDDYAHHPTEIRASLQGLREKYSNKFLVCVFQPHQARRLKELFPDFVRSFKDVDGLILLDVYRVAGRDIMSQKNIDSRELFFAISSLNEPKYLDYVSNSKLIKKAIEKQLEYAGIPPKKAVAVMMGAGDIAELTPLLLK